jgi:hypothetical protein
MSQYYYTCNFVFTVYTSFVKAYRILQLRGILISSAGVKNDGAVPPFPICLHGVVLNYLIEHGDSFTLALLSYVSLCYAATTTFFPT